MDTAEDAGRSVWVLKAITVTIAQADSEMRPYRPIQVPIRNTDLSAHFSRKRRGSKTTFGHVLKAALEDIFGSISYMEDGTTNTWRTTFSLVSDGRTIYGSWVVEPGMVRNGKER